MLWEDRRPALVAGRDPRAGGTWMGLNARGVFCGLTNLWDGSVPDPSRRSRGEAVLEILACVSLPEAARVVDGWETGTFNPFVLVAADVEGRGFWTASPGLRPKDLPAGLHSFGNHLPQTSGDAKPARTRAVMERALERAGDDPADEGLAAALATALGTHHGDRRPAESLCVHTDGDFGTVSSQILLAGPDLARARLWHAPGPPCTTAFVDLSLLLQRLAEAA
jgi:uncharacterized protein with NRDE domain